MSIAFDLRKIIQGYVDDARLIRAEYSTDASNYRVVPEVVVFPKNAEDVESAVSYAVGKGIPVTMRGAGTSVAGNSIGNGIILDTSKFMNSILEIDPSNKTAIVQPGVILGNLQAVSAKHGLRFAPDPSTHARCTIGGMIGNNACGPRSVAFGRTSDNVISLDFIDGNLKKYIANQNTIIPGLTDFVVKHGLTIRKEFGRFKRQVSGYSLEHLLPENGKNLAKTLVGTEGTLGAVLEARVQLVEKANFTALVVAGYKDMPSAADAVMPILKHNPLAIEAIDTRIVEVVKRHKGVASVSSLPNGRGWLFVEVGGSTNSEALANANVLAKDCGTTELVVLPSGPEATNLWRIREDGAGLAGRTFNGNQAWPGWEDASVPPENLGNYLREFELLMKSHNMDGLLYGHFGDGCVHVRIDMPLENRPELMRPFLTDAAVLVAKYGGSLSGEHGDGRARSELLGKMYSKDALSAFIDFKKLFDPKNIMNPGILVNAELIDANLRRPAAAPLPINLRTGGMALKEDQGDFTKAIHKCVGVAKCRIEKPLSTGFMCPSFQATKDETHSTRGRARVLQEMTNGAFIKKDFKSKEVLDSLDLCLSCKACASDCPAKVDMAHYKSEVLYHAYKGKIRPLSHYSLGRLPNWLKFVKLAPGLVNKTLKLEPIAKILKILGGIDPNRELPKFSENKKSFKLNREVKSSKVVLWADSFSESFAVEIINDLVEFLQASNQQVLIPEQDACCGLTFISTGQLDAARKKLKKTLNSLAPFVEAGIPIVGIEPSCIAVLRKDLVELLPDEPRALALSNRVFTLAEFLTKERIKLPNLNGIKVLAQPHCHQYSVMGYATDISLLKEAGATIEVIEGCCGLAGNFGMEKGHFDISEKVAELALLPALRAKAVETVFLADGFSCRTQAEQLVGAKGVHLAQLLNKRQ